MEMRRALLMASSLLALISVSSMAPASAQGYANKRPAVDTSHLQPVEFFHYRPIVSIDDDSAIVNDHRHRQRRKKLVIDVPPMEDDGGVEVITSGPSNPMMGQRFLEDAGPRSYVHHQPLSLGRDLPKGTTTGVHSMQAPQAVAPRGGGLPGSFSSAKRVNASLSLPQQTAVYREPAGSIGSVGGGTSSHVKTNTSAKLLDKIR